MRKLRFRVYEHKLIDGEKNIIMRNIIVLKDEDSGEIVAWTDFHKYARSGTKSLSRSVYSGNDHRSGNATKLLNYVFYEKFHISKLTDIKPHMVRTFLNDYGMCRLPGDKESTHRGKQTVNRCISDTLDFLALMIQDNPSCKLKTKDLFRKVRKFNRKTKKFVEQIVPTFEVNYKPGNRKIFRDIPNGAFKILMNEIIANHKNILMLAALSAFAGLRPSESCNVRRTDSPLGPGLKFVMIDGEVTDIEIDINEEKEIRSDLVKVGRIKKERTGRVYSSFLETFLECYNVYMNFIEGKPYEKEYGALTNNRQGKAYTYSSYCKEFKKAVEDCIPTMLKDEDPQIANYGHMLLENTISPHILRHWFSVQLVLRGEDVAGIMFWRGDKSPESALAYLQNKSELEKQYKLVSEEVFNYSIWRAKKQFQK